MNDIRKMFEEVAKKALKEDKDIGEDSILATKVASNIDHYRICPFRSIDVDDCPLCKLANI
ncbi:MAG: hypothetical protein HN702_01530 [Flavobacteriales bacterium]|jgi:hypothetical protein|nr:hypothetical protein [Flavobacteriales bacterium]